MERRVNVKKNELCVQYHSSFNPLWSWNNFFINVIFLIFLTTPKIAHTKLQIDLKRPTTRKKRPVIMYNDLKKTYNVEETTYNEQKRDSKQPTTNRYLDYFAIWGNYIFNSTFDCNHLSMASRRIIMEKDSQIFIYYVLSCAFITGCKICRILCERFWHL